MKKSIITTAVLLLVVLSATLIFASCGPDKTKVDKAESLYSEVVTLKTNALNSADAMSLAEDDEIRASINSTDAKIAELADVEFSSKSNDELDTIITDLEAIKTTLTTAIDSIGTSAEG